MNCNGIFLYSSYNNVGVKMKKITSLNKISLNEKVLIEKVELDDAVKKRIYDLGIVKNTIIEPVYKSPFNDPVAYLVRGSIIALRNKDAENIFVRRL